jgi:hypothetical protein
MEELGETDKSQSVSAKLVYEVNDGSVNENLGGRKQEDLSLLWETDCHCKVK